MITVNYDGDINIATGLKASSRVWKNSATRWSSLLNKLSNPVRTAETYTQYIRATKAEQGQIKDVGGFVGGYLDGGKRNKESVVYRTLLTLDIDFSSDNLWWDFCMLYDCAACIHSTHKSCKTKPRHRLIIPINRKVTTEEYQAISRRIAGNLGIDLFDQSTFQQERLMFWPSISCDSEYYFESQDGPWLDADSVLATYDNWKDTSEWPTGTDFANELKASVEKQEDPTEKQGIVGAFCKTYSITDVINTFLPNIYEEVDENRYTYKLGSTAGGLIIYDDKFAYSHHGTDPAGGRLCNAFDLVRIHFFSKYDTGKEKSDQDKVSYKKMEQLAMDDSNVKKEIAKEKFELAKAEFSDKYEIDENYDMSWAEELKVSKSGEYESSAKNISIILRNDQALKNLFRLNEFDNRRYITRSAPWRKINAEETVRDVDYAGVRNYIETIYKISSSQKVDDALSVEIEQHKYHPIKDYISNLEWDGIKRVDTLLIDYFGAEDTPYTRASIRKALCAAVARVFKPGIKYDMVLVLVGKQGTYKSTFIRKLGMDWFSDTFTTFQGKEAYEQLQGAWLIEMAELSGLKKAEVESVKQFISKQEDMFRPAYGRVVETYKRQCVFFGTTNNFDFLNDPSGNRRFNPIDIHEDKRTKSVKDDMTDYEVSQIWAEAYELWNSGETLYFDEEETTLARESQHNHSATDERKGLIESYLNKLYPDNWNELDIYDRRSWLDNPLSEKGTKPKDVVCTAEIWCECLGKDKNDMSRYNTREINNIMASLDDWEFISSTRTFSNYGKQKYYKRKDSLI